MTGAPRIPLLPGGLRALLKRREELLVADERAAVQAALDGATPEERERLEELLRPPSGVTPAGAS